ncbi:MAG: hypothetical protein ACKN94_00485, partial [Pirellulaceae bacterium]
MKTLMPPGLPTPEVASRDRDSNTSSHSDVVETLFRGGYPSVGALGSVADFEAMARDTLLSDSLHWTPWRPSSPHHQGQHPG